MAPACCSSVYLFTLQLPQTLPPVTGMCPLSYNHSLSSWSPAYCNNPHLSLDIFCCQFSDSWPCKAQGVCSRDGPLLLQNQELCNANGMKPKSTDVSWSVTHLLAFTPMMNCVLSPKSFGCHYKQSIINHSMAVIHYCTRTERTVNWVCEKKLKKIDWQEFTALISNRCTTPKVTRACYNKLLARSGL